MIFSMHNGDNVTLDGINTRTSVLSKEIDMVSSFEPNTPITDQARSSVNSKDIATFKNVVDSQTSAKDLIKKLATSKKKYDVMSGFAYTMGDIYSYLLRDDNTRDTFNMSENEFDEMVKLSRNMPNLYRTMNFFSTQLMGAPVAPSEAVNADCSITDSEGKQMNIASNIAMEEDDETSDATVKMRYKIYLDFLYNAAGTIKGPKNESATLDNIFPLLTLLWMEDSLMSYRIDTQKATGIYEKDYATETPNKELIPITYLNSAKVLTCKLNKSDVKLYSDSSTFNSYANLSPVLKSSCLRTYTQHKSNMECLDKINTDPFVFARYILRLFTLLLKREIFPKRDTPYSRSEIMEIINGANNPEALTKLFPKEKFKPSFYNKTHSLEEWFNKTEAEVNEEYSISRCNTLDAKINRPTFNALSSAGTGNYPLSTQNKTGTILDVDIEVNHILQLMHLNKLFGTSATTHSDIITDLLNSKRDRAILFEPVLEVSNLKNASSLNITGSLNEKLRPSTSNIFYKILGLDVENNKEDLLNIRNADINFPETDQNVRDYIDKMIDKVVSEIAEQYLTHYYTMGWNFSFMSKKSLLEDLILCTKKSDFGSGFTFLLGDCLMLDVYKEMPEQGRLEKVRCALTKDYKFVYKNIIYMPYLIDVSRMEVFKGKANDQILGSASNIRLGIKSIVNFEEERRTGDAITS